MFRSEALGLNWLLPQSSLFVFKQLEVIKFSAVNVSLTPPLQLKNTRIECISAEPIRYGNFKVNSNKSRLRPFAIHKHCPSKNSFAKNRMKQSP